ncbi:Methyltransferase domain-containing protein [Gemmobacter megaterium]|uniref:Methyltransferase domain-containing protein n=2 Tax=Gemmobacter megaterium TaxID=1086013 RepID=A0A1N7Q302_9RHOB|nr:Methyltransferase domain-containing protein [Gemmobacter megaterium]
MVRRMSAPQLTDPDALMRNRARAAPAPELFLHHLVADEVQDRLSEVNRAFMDKAVVTAFPQVWQSRLDGAQMVAEADVLDLAPASQDLVVHALALHWSNDPVGQIIQCARALRPDGLFIAALFAGQTLAELRTVLAEAEAAVTGGLSPRVLPMAEIRELGGLLQRAGLALPVADSLTQTVSYRDALHLMQDLRAMGEGNALSGRLRRFTGRKVFLQAAALYGDHYPDAESRVRATFEIVFLTGWKPHDSQQKPLRPGSAAQRLADALNAEDGDWPQGG